MIYCQGYTVSFQEVPDEISLTIIIGDCPFRCKGCHSPTQWAQTGTDLEKELGKLIDQYQDAITCVCFMGDGKDKSTLVKCATIARDRGFKTAIYSGYADAWSRYFPYFDYYKCGQYIEEVGGLDSPTTNQYMLKAVPIKEEPGYVQFEDVTSWFRKGR